MNKRASILVLALPFLLTSCQNAGGGEDPTATRLANAVAKIKDNYSLDVETYDGDQVRVKVNERYFAQENLSGQIWAIGTVAADGGKAHSYHYEAGNGNLEVGIYDDGRVDYTVSEIQEMGNLSSILDLKNFKYDEKLDLYHSDDAQDAIDLLALANNDRGYYFGFGHDGIDIYLTEQGDLKQIDILGVHSIYQEIESDTNVFYTLKFSDFGTSSFEVLEEFATSESIELPSPSAYMAKRVDRNGKALYENEEIELSGFVFGPVKDGFVIGTLDGQAYVELGDLEFDYVMSYHHEVSFKAKPVVVDGAVEFHDVSDLVVGEDEVDVSNGFVIYDEDDFVSEFLWKDNPIMNNGSEISFRSVLTAGEVSLDNVNEDGSLTIELKYEDCDEELVEGGTYYFNLVVPSSAEDVFTFIEDSEGIDEDTPLALTNIAYFYNNGTPTFIATDFAQMNRVQYTFEGLINDRLAIMIPSDYPFLPDYLAPNYVAYEPRADIYKFEDEINVVVGNFELSEDNSKKVVSDFTKNLKSLGLTDRGTFIHSEEIEIWVDDETDLDEGGHFDTETIEEEWSVCSGDVEGAGEFVLMYRVATNTYEEYIDETDEFIEVNDYRFMIYAYVLPEAQ